MGIFDSYVESMNLTSTNENSTDILAEEMEYLENLEEATGLSDDPIEACFEAMLQDERNFNNIMMHIAHEEMKYFVENGVEMVYEESRVKSVLAAIHKFLDSTWKRIKAIFEKALSTIKGWVSSDKAFVRKHQDKIKANAGSYKFKGYKVDNQKTNTLWSNVNTAVGSFVKDAKEGKYQDDVAAAIKTKVIGSSDDFDKSLKILFGIDEKVDGVSISAQEVISELTSGDASRKTVKASYDKAKANIAFIKKSATAALTDKSLTGEDKSANGKKINQISKICRSATSILTICQRVQLNAVGIYHSNCRKVARACVTEKADGEDSTNESTTDTDEFAFIV